MKLAYVLMFSGAFICYLAGGLHDVFPSYFNPVCAIGGVLLMAALERSKEMGREKGML